eukprot:TRINITY_DN1267_c0_g2_i1.p1 TRINITY_DN1267_c0_g2~~TRINITY_DN1267_c0_g2_i1.p1  ORF type:complete len:236 (+),score=-9.57 TRINITY_DN1267_c0_g2_i1:76-708(+)
MKVPIIIRKQCVHNSDNKFFPDFVKISCIEKYKILKVFQYPFRLPLIILRLPSIIMQLSLGRVLVMTEIQQYSFPNKLLIDYSILGQQPHKHSQQHPIQQFSQRGKWRTQEAIELSIQRSPYVQKGWYLQLRDVTTVPQHCCSLAISQPAGLQTKYLQAQITNKRHPPYIYALPYQNADHLIQFHRIYATTTKQQQCDSQIPVRSAALSA